MRLNMLVAPATAALVGLALTGPAAATMVGPEDVLDALPESAWAASIIALDDRITAVDRQVTELDPRITPFESRTTEGEETVVTLASDILFAFGEAQIGPAAEARIRELLSEVPDGATVQVHGHTDSISGREFNQRLSEERADAVAKTIRDERADLELEVEGFGLDNPVEPNEVNGEDNPEGRALNRRVEIRFHG